MDVRARGQGRRKSQPRPAEADALLRAVASAGSVLSAQQWTDGSFTARESPETRDESSVDWRVGAGAKHNLAPPRCRLATAEPLKREPYCGISEALWRTGAPTRHCHIHSLSRRSLRCRFAAFAALALPHHSASPPLRPFLATFLPPRLTVGQFSYNPRPQRRRDHVLETHQECVGPMHPVCQF